ncbi:hypothetical protein M422DRAFT_104006, partial [Sphaerobolus stellatus SS14]
DIAFALNVQHDCQTWKCNDTGLRPIIQEREKTNQTISFIEHQEDNTFILNTFAVHNTYQLRRILPRSLVAPVPLHEDQYAFHCQIADKVQSTRTGR